jgi:small subunit ribosomal protein S11
MNIISRNYNINFIFYIFFSFLNHISENNYEKTYKKFSLCKGRCRIPKGVIHIRANFNNTIITITNIWGQAIFWSFVSAFGFRGTKKSMPFTAQTATKNVIRMLIDQVMKEAKIMINGLGLGRDTTL